MKATGRATGADARLFWLACIVVLCAGYYVSFVVLATAIDRQHEETARVSDAVRLNAQIAAQRPQLELEQRAADELVRSFDLRADRATLVARFVQSAVRIAGERHVSLDQVDARGTAAASAPASAPGQNANGGFSFESIPLEISLRGNYAALLATIRDLARTPLPLQIEIAAIEREGPAAGNNAGPLTARLHLMVQRLADDVPAGVALHQLPEDGTSNVRSQ
ncbi:MAG: hypothetical protein ABSB70_10260 [Candidatus Velthaea sp.]